MNRFVFTLASNHSSLGVAETGAELHAGHRRRRSGRQWTVGPRSTAPHVQVAKLSDLGQLMTWGRPCCSLLGVRCTAAGHDARVWVGNAAPFDPRGAESQSCRGV